MYHRQKGFLQTFVYLVGLLIAGFFLFGTVTNIMIAINRGFFISASVEQLIRSFALLFILVFMSSMGIIFVNFFPDILITESGIKVKYPLCIMYFRWNEVQGIVNAAWPKGAKAIIISPKGNILENFFRLYPQRIHGLVARVHEPAVILSNETEKRTEILENIKHHTSHNAIF